MSETLTQAASAPASLSAELKAAVVAAADAHLAAVMADVARVKGAVSSDLAGMGPTGKTEFDRLEGSVIAEIAKLRADLAGAPLRHFAVAAVAVVATAAAALGHFVSHLF